MYNQAKFQLIKIQTQMYYHFWDTAGYKMNEKCKKKWIKKKFRKLFSNGYYLYHWNSVLYVLLFVKIHVTTHKLWKF